MQGPRSPADFGTQTMLLFRQLPYPLLGSRWQNLAVAAQEKEGLAKLMMHCPPVGTGGLRVHVVLLPVPKDVQNSSIGNWVMVGLMQVAPQVATDVQIAPALLHAHSHFWDPGRLAGSFNTILEGYPAGQMASGLVRLR